MTEPRRAFLVPRNADDVPPMPSGPPARECEERELGPYLTGLTVEDYRVALRKEWTRPVMSSALAARDFSIVYRQLQKVGYSQQLIGWLTRQSQPEISAVTKGRRISGYDVMDRVVAGLGIPRCLVRMGSCCCHTPCQVHSPDSGQTPEHTDTA